MDLLNLKMQKGALLASLSHRPAPCVVRFTAELTYPPSFRTGPGFGEFTNDQETVFERIARGPEGKTSAVVDHGAPGQWHGAKAKTAIACTNDEEVSVIQLVMCGTI